MLTRSKRKNNLDIAPDKVPKPTKSPPSPRASSESEFDSDSCNSDSAGSNSELDSTDDELQLSESDDEYYREPIRKKIKFASDARPSLASDSSQPLESDASRESSDGSDDDSAIHDLWGASLSDALAKPDLEKWKADLTPEEISAHEIEFSAISYQISLTPTIGSVLKLNIPFKEKCELVEKIYILGGLCPDTADYFAAKSELFELIRQRESHRVTRELCEKYECEEKSLDDTECIPVKYQILGADMPKANKAVLLRKYNQLSALSPSNSEHPKLNEWIKWALSIPFSSHLMSKAAPMEYLSAVKSRLDADVYGLEQVKEQLLFVLNRKLTTPASAGSGIAVVGPPGTAKTSLIQSLAKAINLPMVQISLGGAKDGSFLDGHGYTYEGSTPGAIVYALRQLKCNDGIIFFDEFDKISNTAYGAEISRLLLHITDFTQNHTFHDKYLSNEFPVDLSKIWFIYSLNDADMLDRTLRDRIPIIRLRGYSKSEKKHIATKHLIPRALDNNNLRDSEIEFSDAAIDFLIQKSEEPAIADSSGKSGVRQLKHNIENITMKLSLLKTSLQDPGVDLKLSFEIKGFKLPIMLTMTMVEALLGTSSEPRTNLSMYL